MTTTARGMEEQQTLEGKGLVRTAETAVTAAAETAKAMVQARFLVALNRPRNFDNARIRLLAACRRPRFAAMARYKKPVGGSHVEGPSIRFADEAVKILGNIDTRQEVIYEDDEQRIVQVSVTDLETNLSKADTICIKKVVERKKIYKGQEIIGKRENTRGEEVFLVRASDDELVNKEANLCAKKRRNLELQLIPQDLIEECEDEVRETMCREDKEDPEASRKRVLDSFAALGVMPSDLESYLGHGTASCSPAEMQGLREIYAAIRDGQTSWSEVVETKNGDSGKAERGKVNLDDIKPGNAEDHKPVDAPVRGKKAQAAAKPSGEPTDTSPTPDEYRRAYAKLSLLYDERGNEIDDMLRMNGIDVSLMDVPKDCADAHIMREVVKIAKEF